MCPVKSLSRCHDSDSTPVLSGRIRSSCHSLITHSDSLPVLQALVVHCQPQLAHHLRSPPAIDEASSAASSQLAKWAMNLTRTRRSPLVHATLSDHPGGLPDLPRRISRAWPLNVYSQCSSKESGSKNAKSTVLGDFSGPPSSPPTISGSLRSSLLTQIASRDTAQAALDGCRVPVCKARDAAGFSVPHAGLGSGSGQPCEQGFVCFAVDHPASDLVDPFRVRDCLQQPSEPLRRLRSEAMPRQR